MNGPAELVAERLVAAVLGPTGIRLAGSSEKGACASSSARSLPPCQTMLVLAMVEFSCEDARIGVARIAEGAGQALALLVLDLPLGRAHPAVLVGDVAVLDVEGVDHAVAAEPVVRPARRELRVGAVAVERAAELLGHLAGDVQMARIGLGVHRGVVAVQEGIVGREGLGHDALRSSVKGNAVYLSDAINTHCFPQEDSSGLAHAGSGGSVDRLDGEGRMPDFSATARSCSSMTPRAPASPSARASAGTRRFERCEPSS